MQPPRTYLDVVGDLQRQLTLDVAILRSVAGLPREKIADEAKRGEGERSASFSTTPGRERLRSGLSGGWTACSPKAAARAEKSPQPRSTFRGSARKSSSARLKNSSQERMRVIPPRGNERVSTNESRRTVEWRITGMSATPQEPLAVQALPPRGSAARRRWASSTSKGGGGSVVTKE